MSTYKRNIAKAAITILPVVLLSITSYYLFPEFSPTTFAVVSFRPDVPLGESLLEPIALRTAFGLSNGYISLPIETYNPSPGDPFNWTEFMTKQFAIPYNGEFNGTLLRSITVCSIGKGGGLVFSPDISYNLTCVRHKICQVSLRIGEDITDMGVSGWWDSVFYYRRGTAGGGHGLWGHADYEIGPTGKSGYWGIGSKWGITADQLSNLLQGSGTATLEFNATISRDTNYTLVTPSRKETGEHTVNWEGTLGNIEITYDQGTILWIKYDFKAVVLVVLPIQE